MKRLADSVNKRLCEPLPQTTADYLYRVCGSAGALALDTSLLASYLETDFAVDFDALCRLHAMAAKIRSFSEEMADLINVLEEKEVMP